MCTKIYIYRDILEVMQCLIKVMPVICNVNENKNRNHMRNYNHHHSKIDCRETLPESLVGFLLQKLDQGTSFSHIVAQVSIFLGPMFLHIEIEDINWKHVASIRACLNSMYTWVTLV